MLCLNLCELYPPSLLSGNVFDRLLACVEQSIHRKVERVSIGSSFCSQFFLGAPCLDELMSLIASRGWPVVLTIPIFSQRDLQKGKDRIMHLCHVWNKQIDEVTCNDPGMLKWLENHVPQKINMGQLFFKDPRDFRYGTYQAGSISLVRASHPFSNSVSGIELSPVVAEIHLPESAIGSRSVALHQPYCYMSTGHICKFAAMTHRIEQKFRPNSPCNLQCSSVLERTYLNESTTTPILRIGRTLFFEQRNCAVIHHGSLRILYWPIDELLQLKGLENEDTYTT